jgi:mevalonate kinase
MTSEAVDSPLYNPQPESCFLVELEEKEQARFTNELGKAYKKMNTELDSRIEAFKQQNPDQSFWNNPQGDGTRDNKKLIEGMNIAQPLLMEAKKELKEMRSNIVMHEILSKLSGGSLYCVPVEKL